MKLDASCLCIGLELLCSLHEWISSLFTVRLELLKILLTSFGLKSILSDTKIVTPAYFLVPQIFFFGISFFTLRQNLSLE